MITFSKPRVASEIATIVLGRHSDPEVDPAVIEHVTRRARIHVDLIVGSRADEQVKDSIITDTLVYAIRRNRVGGSKDRSCESSDDFLAELRRLIVQHCRQLGYVQRRHGY